MDIPMDPEEEEVLAPNHFLLGSSNGIKPKAMRAAWDPENSLEKWNEIVDAFWTKLPEVYLPTILPRSTGQRKKRGTWRWVTWYFFATRTTELRVESSARGCFRDG